MNNEEARQKILDAFKLKERIDAATKRYNGMRKELGDYIEENRIDELSTGVIEDKEFTGVILTAKISERVSSLVYDTDKLKERLDKETYNEVVDKTYTINDIDALISLLKSAGISPSTFKKLITVTEVADKARIQQLFSVGELSFDQIQGCYSATISKSVNITKSKAKMQKG